MKNHIRSIIFILLISCFITVSGFSQGKQEKLDEKTTEEVLPFKEFIRLATTNDTEFEQILIDELTLTYQKALQIPAKDLVFSVKQQHEMYLSQNRESPDTTLGLSKLFPYTGTELSLSYEVGSSIGSSSESSEISFSIAQPIAENAFGRSTRLLDKIVGLEVDIARHQIIEAYEDYLATIMTVYYTWYEDYQNLIIARSSYKENLKLLDNIKERQKENVALPVDVNKVQLQLLSKKEKLIELEEKYKNSFNVVKRVVRRTGEKTFIPKEPFKYTSLEKGFEYNFEKFTEESRTFEILKKLERKSSFQVDRDADDLLPSIDFLVGYKVAGEKYMIEEEDNMLFAGISIEWPFSDQVEKAEYEVSKIEDRKTNLSTKNTYYKLHSQLSNLYLEIKKEEELIGIADEKIRLAQEILEDESENYSFGKITLNDYIQAVNDLDTARFNKIFHESEYKKLLIEWLRLTDELVERKNISSKIEKVKEKYNSN